MTVWKTLCCGLSPCPCLSGNRVGVGDKEIYLLMLGLDNAGKTCTAKSMVGEVTDLEEVAPTVGFAKVQTKYKGYKVIIYDLGGSQSFRGIWPKYFHEVHGLVFVVDASDQARNEECREIFREILRHDKVKGKPVLFLCNKADLEEAQDEIDIVEAMNVEQVVNEARCPTRVEPSVAVKNHGLRVGFKWLVKSVIANYGDLGPRVSADVDLELRLRERRRKEIQRRIEERKKMEEEEEHESQEIVEVAPKPAGFVALDRLKAQWSEPKDASPNNPSPQVIHSTPKLPPIQSQSNGYLARVDKLPKLDEEKVIDSGAATGAEDVPSEEDFDEALDQMVSEACSTQVEELNDGHPSVVFNSVGLPTPEKLELEPIAEPKKRRSLMKKLNSRGSKVAFGVHTQRRNSSIDSGTSVSVRSSTSKPNSANSSVESVRDTQVIRAYIEQ